MTFELADPTAVAQRVAHEVHRPALVGADELGPSFARRRGQALAPAATHDKPFLGVDPPHPLVVDHQAAAPQEQAESTVAEARSLGGQSKQL